MNKNCSSFRQTRCARALRLETLEERQMLSVNPIEVGVAVSAAEEEFAATEVVAPEVVDLGELEETASELTFAATDVASHYVMSWDAIPDAQAYNVKISRDGGETWITYAKPTESNLTIKGVYVGNSYSYRVFGVDEAGKLFGDALEGTFAPIKLSTSTPSYHEGDTVSVATTGAENASADIAWYYTTEDGDVAIPDAAEQTEYTPPVADSTIKVVATGTGDSTGARSEVTIRAEGPYESYYDAENRRLTLDWSDVDDAEIYRVLISRDGGATWLTYANPTDSTVTISGLYVGCSYSFRVEGYRDATKITPSNRISSTALTFAPIKLTASTPSYNAGDTISVAVAGAENASAEIAWYYVTEDGDVAIPEAAGMTEYTPTFSAATIKVVATGTGDSVGSRAEVTIAAEEFFDVDYDAENRKATLDWSIVADAAIYRVLISRDGGQSWNTYAKPTVSCVTVDGIYPGNSYSFRVEAYNNAAKIAPANLIESATLTFAPVKVAASAPSYNAGDTISVATVGAENASADFAWYYATDDGDVAIPEAAGMSEYTPTTADSPIKVVATGTEDSAGSSAEVTISVEPTVGYEYDATTRLLTLDWSDVDGAEIHRVLISRNGGESWITYAKPTDSCVTIVGIYVGKSYSFRVEAYNNASKIAPSTIIASTELTFAPNTIDEAFAGYVDELL